jgi:RimJ/RimL family protein N-acetyltransferase
VIAPPACSLNIPIVETQRLKLRGHTMEDFAHTLALWSDVAVVKFLGGKPFTLEECWTRFLRNRGHWCVLGFGYWVVEEKETGDFVGEVGFGNFKRDMEPPLGATPELGWVLAPAKHGKGYATEAAKGALDWGRKHFAVNDFICIINPAHRASLRVAGKCGFEQQSVGTYKGKPSILFRLTV